MLKKCALAAIFSAKLAMRQKIIALVVKVIDIKYQIVYVQLKRLKIFIHLIVHLALINALIVH